MQTTIDLKILAAVAKAASKEEARFYLKGVKIEAREKHVAYIATDGHILIAARAERYKDDGTPLLGDWILPSEVIARYKPASFKNFSLAILSSNGTKLAIEFNGEKIEFLPIDGAFPDWRRALPSEISGETAQFDPALLSRLSAAGKMFGGDGRLTIAHNGGGPAIVSFGSGIEDAFGVIMPLRSAANPKLPAWTKEKSE